MRTISFRLDDQTDALLQAYCARSGLNQSQALKEAIVRMSSVDKPSPGRLARELGLAGAFRSGDGQLAEQHSQRLKERLRQRRPQQGRGADEEGSDHGGPGGAMFNRAA